MLVKQKSKFLQRKCHEGKLTVSITDDYNKVVLHVVLTFHI